MNENLVNRMNKAINKIGGAAALLDILDTFPDYVKNAIILQPDYEKRVEIVELIADQCR